MFFFSSYGALHDLHSFPTRRSSDLWTSPPAIGDTAHAPIGEPEFVRARRAALTPALLADRSEEHTSELQSRGHLVCRLLLEKKKEKNKYRYINHEYITCVYMCVI